MDSPIRGMESVVATVSGYQGAERFNLIKLISQAGANYVGSMSRSITHLVCWEFKGRKYELAKKFKTIIVNHQWVEDCVKQGKRVPEHHYRIFSGKELGPLSLEVPIIDKAGFPNKNCKPLLDKSNIFEDFERRKIGISCLGWTDSLLLNENFFPEVNRNNTSASKSKPKLVNKSSKHEDRSSGRHCFKDPPLSSLVILENEGSSLKSSVREKEKISGHKQSSSTSDKQLVKGKRKIFDNIGITLFAEPSCNGQRLVKKNVCRDNLEINLLISDQECHPVRLHKKNSDSVASSTYEDCERNTSTLETGRTSDSGLNASSGASPNETFDDIQDIRNWTNPPASKDSNSHPEASLTALDRPEAFLEIEDFDGKNRDVSQSERITRLPTSVELSCVICWTEFSSIRGVLPCGHRFCYSCIQSWADHMIASRKNSTCPLCKASFVSITKVEGADPSDQKIYSQTFPYASTTEVLLLHDQERYKIGAESSLATVCVECSCREPEELLVSCQYCQSQCIHIYCLDPPLFPWTCIHCKDLQRLYHHAR